LAESPKRGVRSGRVSLDGAVIWNRIAQPNRRRKLIRRRSLGLFKLGEK